MLIMPRRELLVPAQGRERILRRPAIIRPREYGFRAAIGGRGGHTPDFPSIAGSAKTAESASGSPFTVSLPASIAAGELLVAIADRAGGAQTFTWPGSWSEIASVDISGRHIAIAKLTATGSEGASISVTSSLGTSQNRTAICLRITPWASVEISSSATGSSANPNPPSLSPSWGSYKTLWLAFAAGGNSTSSVSSYPSNYTLSQLYNSGFTWSVHSARQNETATENPGTYTMNVSAVWAAYTVGVKGA